MASVLLVSARRKILTSDERKLKGESDGNLFPFTQLTSQYDHFPRCASFYRPANSIRSLLPQYTFVAVAQLPQDIRHAEKVQLTNSLEISRWKDEKVGLSWLKCVTINSAAAVRASFLRQSSGSNNAALVVPGPRPVEIALMARRVRRQLKCYQRHGDGHFSPPSQTAPSILLGVLTAAGTWSSFSSRPPHELREFVITSLSAT